MNLYIPHGDFDFFLEKTKENEAINDIFVSEERLEKVKIAINMNDDATVNEVLKTLPSDGMIIDRNKKPSKEYILCVGEVEEMNFVLIEREKHSILIKKENKVKFNSWIKITELDYYYNLGVIENFSTINNKLEEWNEVKIETKVENFQEVKKILEEMNFEINTQETEIYAKVKLEHLKVLYELTEKNILKLDIL